MRWTPAAPGGSAAADGDGTVPGYYLNDRTDPIMGPLPVVCGGGGATVAPASNTLVFWRMLAMEGVELDEVSFYLSTAGPAGSLCRVGCYTADPVTGMPADLVADSGAIVSEVVGVINQPVGPFTVPGLVPHWGAYLCNNGTIALRFAAAPSFGTGRQFLPIGNNAAGITSITYGLTAAQAWGALPATAPAAAYSTNGQHSAPFVIWTPNV